MREVTYNTYQIQDPTHNAIDVLMPVTDTSYAISFGGSDGGVTLQTGAFSGSLPSAASGKFKTVVTIQAGGPKLTKRRARQAAILQELHSPPEDIARMEHEMETLGQEFKVIEESHGKNVLNLVIVYARGSDVPFVLGQQLEDIGRRKKSTKATTINDNNRIASGSGTGEFAGPGENEKLVCHATTSTPSTSSSLLRVM